VLALAFRSHLTDNFSCLLIGGGVSVAANHHDPVQMLQLLNQICSAFSERLDRRTLVSRILEYAIELGNGERGTIFLAPVGVASTEKGELKSLIATGLGGKEITVDVTKGVAGHVFREQQGLIINDAQSDPRFYRGIDQVTGYTTKSILAVPMKTPSGRRIGVIQVLNSRTDTFAQEDLMELQVMALFAAVAIDHRETVDTLTETNEKLNHVRWDRMNHVELCAMRSCNSGLQDLYDKIPTFAQSDSSILIEGESGTGKEVIAQLIHQNSRRKDRAFVALNCAAIPESLFEAELFGVAKGAATGTIARKGKIELAHGGTLFMDEIGELPLSAQAKLLRVLQERAVTRVGSEDERPRPVDFRIVAATNRNLAEMVRQGKFREDLFYRINVVCLRLPPLRERLDDIPELARSIMERLVATRGQWKPKGLSEDATRALKRYSWPGNIRQLHNKIEGAMILSGTRPTLEAKDFPLESPNGEASSTVPTLSVVQGGGELVDFNLKRAKQLFENRLIEKALERTGGNKTEAAKLLGITREGLRKALMKAA
jgi:Nif-specific regulatory protein